MYLARSGVDTLLVNADNGVIKFGTNNTERMRIDSSGKLLVGKTSSTGATAGCELRENGMGLFTRSSANPLQVRRLTDDGVLVDFYKDTTAVGTILTSGGTVVYAGNTHGIMLNGSTIAPSNDSGTRVDNTMDIGSSSFRYDDIFATNGTIQTSDQNEKQDIASLTSAEMLVAKRISALFKTFRWKDKVAEKGDNARTHTGIVAQDVQTAFAAESLDAGDYSLFISSTWLVDSEGNEVAEGTEGAVSKTRMGIRYPELLSFVAAYNEQRFANIETRLTALEG